MDLYTHQYRSMSAMILMFMERWGLAAGCGDYGLVDSGRTRVKGLKRPRQGRGSIQRLHGGGGGEEGVKGVRVWATL